MELEKQVKRLSKKVDVDLSTKNRVVYRTGTVASAGAESYAYQRVCHSFLFIYFILKYNSGVSRNVLMIWAFLLGLTVDILGNTPGMNAAAATVLAFMREPVLRLVTLRDSVEDFEPGIKSMGFSPFFRYILLCTFLFCTIYLS